MKIWEKQKYIIYDENMFNQYKILKTITQDRKEFLLLFDDFLRQNFKLFNESENLYFVNSEFGLDDGQFWIISFEKNKNISSFNEYNLKYDIDEHMFYLDNGDSHE